MQYTYMYIFVVFRPSPFCCLEHKNRLFPPFFSLFLIPFSVPSFFIIFDEIFGVSPCGRASSTQTLLKYTKMCDESISFRQFLNFDNRPRRSKVIDNNVELMKLLSLSKNMYWLVVFEF